MKILSISAKQKERLFPLLSCACGFSIMWLCSIASLGFFPISMTLQTCGVHIIAFLMSPMLAFSAIGSWLCAGAMGVPCFSGGACGFGHLFGPSSGYFLGMLIAAPVMSFLMRLYQKNRSGILPSVSFFTLFSISLFGVVLVLSLGWCLLSFVLGNAIQAWHSGVKIFLATDVAKAFFGCLLIKGVLIANEK